jgi:hypothetical protein
MSKKPMPRLIQWIGQSVFMRILSELAPNYLEYPAGRSLPPLQTYGSRKEAVSTIRIPKTAWMQPIRLCPSWPSVAAGGARYLHSVRAFYLESWKILLATDHQFWDPYDKGGVPHLIFGREPDVGPRPILDVPASELTRDRIKRCGNAIGLHATLCEYMVTNPIEGRRFYHRLESAQTFRVKLLGRHRDLGHMIEYRQLLQALGCEPDRNPAWAQSEFATRFISRMQRGVERYQMEMAENRSIRRRARREREEQGEESAPRRVRYEGDLELMEDSGPSTSAPVEQEEPMETAPVAQSLDRATPPPSRRPRF